MNRFLMFAAITSSKVVSILSELMGNKSSALPGKVARTIYPKTLELLGKQIKKEIIIVTGTNGKTTTNNMIHDILKASGQWVVCNDVGANMINGVTTAFVKQANVFGQLKATYACIEADEASLQKVVDEITPTKIVITNLFRDQLDRYGEIDLTAKAIDKALEKLADNDVTLILNADDPLTAQFKYKHNMKTYFYGVGDNKVSKSCEETREGRFCAFCGTELTYKYYFYSQLGDYICPKCDFKRPVLDYAAINVDITDGIHFDLKNHDKNEPLSISYTGFYNVYNCLAAAATTLALGVKIDSIQKALTTYKPQIGRMEKFQLTKPVILNLSKNPAGFNQAIATVTSDTRKKNVLIIINDNAQDGRDVSWLWDCYFENLMSANINKYYISGIRKEDMAVRLKYAGIPKDKIFIKNDIKKTIENIINDNIEIAYVLANYTAIFETQNILKGLETQPSPTSV